MFKKIVLFLFFVQISFSQSKGIIILANKNTATPQVKEMFINLGFKVYDTANGAKQDSFYKDYPNKVFICNTAYSYSYPHTTIGLILMNRDGKVVFQKSENTYAKGAVSFNKKNDRRWVLNNIGESINLLFSAAETLSVLNEDKEEGKPDKPALNDNKWFGNGSGLIISKSGYIVTNYHVIKDADDIEVEFIIDGKFMKLNAEVVQLDKVNDLAIIKIFDMNFDGLDNLPYNFKTRSSDVGTKVYAYGYPMALSLMGKEIKITDGIISSKSGFDGDITTYQITAPIQGGNSGGPLFDDKGNFLGINSSGLSKEIADNVGYTIKSSYVLNLIDVLPKSIDLPSSTKLQSLPLTEQIKEISKYVVMIKVK